MDLAFTPEEQKFREEVRTRQKIHSPYCASVVQAFWPLTMYLSPFRSALVLTEARSEPEPGSL